MSHLMKLLGGSRTAKAESLPRCYDCLIEFERGQDTRAVLSDLAGALLESFAARLAPRLPERSAEFAGRARDLRAGAGPLLSGEEADRLRRDADPLFDDFAEALEQNLKRKRAPLEEALAVLAGAARSSGDPHAARFQGLGRQLRDLASTHDLETIARRLRSEVRRLERYAEERRAGADPLLERLDFSA